MKNPNDLPDSPPPIRSVQASARSWQSASRLSLILLLVLVPMALVSCPGLRHHVSSPEPARPWLTANVVARVIPEKVKQREGWAEDVLATLETHRLPRSVESVAAVLAILEQESGFHANPVVPGLPKLVRSRLDSYVGGLGPLAEPALKRLLQGSAPDDPRSFYARIDVLETERDLDLLFRDLFAYYRDRFPVTFAAASLLGGLFTAQQLEDLNPITTAGSMQVSVRYAQELARTRGRDPAQVREEIYTRRGGLYYGVARLLLYDAHYNAPVYRFADYNAGFYASRNAALQAALTRVTGIELVPDGDFLLYDKQGNSLNEDSRSLKALLQFRARSAPDLSEWRVRRDVQMEKSLDFELTETVRALLRVYQAQTGQAADYAHLPRVTLSSPKLSQERTTAWFARSVNKRYQKYVQALEALRPRA